MVWKETWFKCRHRHEQNLSGSQTVGGDAAALVGQKPPVQGLSQLVIPQNRIRERQGKGKHLLGAFVIFFMFTTLSED